MSKMELMGKWGWGVGGEGQGPRTSRDPLPYTRSFMSCISDTEGRYRISLVSVLEPGLKSRSFHFHTLLHVNES